MTQKRLDCGDSGGLSRRTVKCISCEILAHIPQKGKESFAAQLKEIWLVPSVKLARQRAK